MYVPCCTGHARCIAFDIGHYERLALQLTPKSADPVTMQRLVNPRQLIKGQRTRLRLYFRKRALEA